MRRLGNGVVLTESWVIETAYPDCRLEILAVSILENGILSSEKVAYRRDSDLFVPFR